MAQPIQIILMRQLAGYLSVPMFLVGPNGDLLFYNEPAETILGRRFDETGTMSAKEWSAEAERLINASGKKRRCERRCGSGASTRTSSKLPPTSSLRSG